MSREGMLNFPHFLKNMHLLSKYFYCPLFSLKKAEEKRKGIREVLFLSP